MAPDTKWHQDKIKELRKKLGLTQNELARQLGCRQQTVSEWEIGLYAPANAYGKLLSQLALRVAATPSFSATFHSRLGTSPRGLPPILSPIDEPKNFQSNSSHDEPVITEDYVDKGFDPAID